MTLNDTTTAARRLASGPPALAIDPATRWGWSERAERPPPEAADGLTISDPGTWRAIRP